jgi:SAM-dependent methyltransferase
LLKAFFREHTPKLIWNAMRSGQDRLKNEIVRVRYRSNNVPVPPLRIIELVAGTRDVEWYVSSGARAADCVRQTLQQSQINLEHSRRILDFGCGCGRVLYHLQALARASEIYGCDYNPILVAWAHKCVPLAKVQINALAPPLPYESGSFDLVYAFSTFTHWTVELQKEWIAELTRVLRPNGLLIFTTHGDYYRSVLLPDDREKFDCGQPIVLQPGSTGANTCAAFHPFAFVRDELLKNLTLLNFLPRAALGNPHQDVYLARKP